MTRDPATPAPDPTQPYPQMERGLVGGIAAYVIWGLFPLFWPLLDRAGAVEILAHRVIWSLLFAALACLILQRAFWRRPAGRKEWAILVIAGFVIAINWGTYIWAVNNGRVLDASLGYYINPILSILFGVIFLRERLARPQWIAVGLAAVAVIVMTVEYGHPPWAALVMAVSFGTYGVLKKGVRIDAPSGMVIEGLGGSVVAIAFLTWLSSVGQSTFTAHGPGHTVLLITGGLVTLLPLLLFSDAAPRVPLTVMGMLQYIAPTMQFVIGWLVRGEDMPPGRWVGFALVWVALTIITVHAVRARRRAQPALARPR